MLLVTNVCHVLTAGHSQCAALGSSGTAELQLLRGSVSTASQIQHVREVRNSI